MFRMEVEKSGDVAIMRCSGRLVRGESAEQLQSAVMAQAGARIIVLDLTDVTMVDGGGLGMLVSARQWSKDNGLQLKLVNPSPIVMEVLERTHLSYLFDVSSVDDALAILGCERVRAASFPAMAAGF